MLQGKSTNASRCLACALVVIIYGVTTSLAAEQMSSRPTSAAGTPLSWEQAIRTALEKQPLIKMAEHEALESQALVKQIESANYPQVTGIVASCASRIFVTVVRRALCSPASCR
jgi:outer membrane protein TolC